MDRFRFQNAEMQQSLERLYGASGIPHDREPGGALVCEDAFESRVEALRSSVRYQRFPEWHTCCVDSGEVDEDARIFRVAAMTYLAERGIPHEVEEHGPETWLLMPGDEVLPDSLWESVYGPVSTLTPVQPRCCYCQQPVQEPSFGEISVRRPEGGFRSVLYSHLECLRGSVHPEAVHIIDTKD